MDQETTFTFDKEVDKWQMFLYLPVCSCFIPFFLSFLHTFLPISVFEIRSPVPKIQSCYKIQNFKRKLFWHFAFNNVIPYVKGQNKLGLSWCLALDEKVYYIRLIRKTSKQAWAELCQAQLSLKLASLTA